MRWTLFKQALVIARRPLTPPRVGVINTLIRKNEHVLLELNHPLVVVCHAGSLMAEGDIAWRRPEPSPGGPGDYSGPPAGEPPPAGWHLAVPEPTAPPRQLPTIDHDAIDLAEQQAARFTYTIAFTALGMLLLLACWRFF